MLLTLTSWGQNNEQTQGCLDSLKGASSFTPNGDGYHETWFVQNSDFEPDFMVEIYSRYGKLLTTFSSKSEGWDGTYNGRMMPSDDYWFLVHRQDGTIYKGHFALKR